MKRPTTLESGKNLLLCLLIFGIFSRGYGLITDLDLNFLHKFAHFKGLRLFFLSNFPEATFIQGATSIPESRVLYKIKIVFKATCTQPKQLNQVNNQDFWWSI